MGKSASSAPAQKFTYSQVVSSLREATVQVFAFEVGANGSFTGKYGTGTGSFVAPSVVLTNHHVISKALERPTLIFVLNKSIGFHKAELLASAQADTPLKVDAALLSVPTVRSHGILPISPKPRLDEWISIAGYPGDAQDSDLRASRTARAIFSGNIPEVDNFPTALVDEGRLNNIIFNPRFRSEELQYTMITAPGNSGSPVVNACGEIVGLHYRGSGTSVKYNSSVHGRDVAVFLDLMKVDYNRRDQECQVDR